MPIKPATEFEIKALVPILMDPNDERDLLAARKIEIPNISRSPKSLSPKIIPDKNELITKILSRSKEIRVSIDPSLEEMKERDPNYNQVLMDRAIKRAEAFILEYREHNASLAKKSNLSKVQSIDEERAAKYFERDLKKTDTRQRSHSR